MSAGSAVAAGPAGSSRRDVDPDADRWLVDRARGGDADAYEELLRRHRNRIYRIALRMLGDPADADDVTQDVAIQVWTALSGFTGRAAFTTWLYRVVVNRCLNHRRGRRPTEELTEELTGELTGERHLATAGPERRVLASEELRAGLELVASLPEQQRAVMVLVQLEGLTYPEAAKVLRVSEATVRGRLQRARATVLNGMRDWT